MLIKILRRLFPGTLMSEYMAGHSLGYFTGRDDGYKLGEAAGLRMVPGHYQDIQRNLDACSADRARLTRELNQMKDTKL